MKALVAILAIILVGGGGYYMYMQQQAPTPQPVPLGTSDDIMMQEGDSDMMEDHDSATTSDSSTASETPEDTGTVVGETKEFAVTNSGFNYSPKNLTVKRGDRVRITYTNGGGTHDMRIEGYDVGTKVIQANQSETFEFVADEAGTFEFYCSVGNHRANGMVGTFTVTN